MARTCQLSFYIYGMSSDSCSGLDMSLLMEKCADDTHACLVLERSKKQQCKEHLACLIEQLGAVLRAFLARHSACTLCPITVNFQVVEYYCAVNPYRQCGPKVSSPRSSRSTITTVVCSASRFFFSQPIEPFLPQ